MSGISIDLLVEQIVLVPKTDIWSSDEINEGTQLPWLQLQKWPSLYHLYGYLELRSS